MEAGGHGHYGTLAQSLVVVDCRADIAFVTILCPNMMEKSASVIPKAPAYAAPKPVPLVSRNLTYSSLFVF